MYEMFFYISLNFILGHFKLNEEFIFVPQLALPPTVTTPNWHYPKLALFCIFCAVEDLQIFESPTADVPLKHMI